MTQETELQDRQQIDGLLESMPASLVRKVLDFTTALRQKYVEHNESGLSFEWTEADMREWMNSGVEHMDAECPWDECEGDSSDAQPR